MATSVKRLYKELKPAHYQLEIIPDMEALTFRGSVTVDLKKTGRPSQRLTFHQHGLKIDSARIIKRDKKSERELPVARINNQNTLNEVRLHTDEMVYAGDYRVTMEFHGVVSKAMVGLYPCRFTMDGKEQLLLATQFESHFARSVFPCVDEPEAKATFELTVQAPQGTTVLSNTPVAEESTLQDGAHKRVRFETTPQMSTYLLAFVMGELHSATVITKRGTAVSVWSTPIHPLSTLQYALDVAKQSIEFYEDYFDVPYPLPKADHVALPDFEVGAMENWGLITYRERLLVAYPGEASQSLREHIAMVIAHETSHQWFGNLVTMRWWDDLWLNESFANMMEFEAVNHMFPEWHVWESFAASEGLSALRRDATAGVQSVRTGVRHPDEINTLFDPSIVYAKGSRLLYMLKTYIGETAFRSGLTAYFRKHAYRNTTGADLWEALSAASREDIGAFMNPWLEQAGFPVVSLKREDRTATITQQHFQENGLQNDGRLWPVPLFANQPAVPKLLDKAVAHAKLAQQTPLIINQAAAGHYIVHYEDAADRTAIIDLVRQQTLGATDRLMLLNSASMLSKAGVQPFQDALTLLAAYEREHAEPVWGMIALILSEARRFIDLDESLEPRIKAFIRKLVASEVKRLGWQETTDESAADTKLRATVLSLAAYAEDPTVIKQALRLFEDYQAGKTVPAELRSLIFSVAVKEKVGDAFDWLLTLHDETPNSDLQADACAGLTATKDPAAAAVLLERVTDTKLIKPQDADFWIVSLLRNRHTRQVAWGWLVEHWDWIVKMYAPGKMYDHFPRYAAGVCNTKEWAAKYEAFFEPKRGDINLARNIAMGLNEIATRVAWLERDLPGVQTFFA